jgi:ribonuclease Z
MTVHLLGTGSAQAGPDRTTTMLAVEAAGRLVLIDCGGDAVQRMLACGLDPAALDAVVLTHEHPDHISGYPLLLEKLWLLGRRDPLPLYGPGPTLDKAEALFAVFETSRWDGLPKRDRHPVALEAGAAVFQVDGLEVTATPVVHPVPTIGLRFEADGACLAYSCDTAPTEAVVALARNADVLVHEATGHLPGVHSSPEEAAAVAAEAGAGRLVLVHAPVGASDDGLAEARATFAGAAWGHDGDRVDVARP